MILRRPQNFAKSPPIICLIYCQSNNWWRFRKILWHFQNIWILWTIVCIWKKCLKMRKWAQFLSCCQTDFTFQTFGISFLNEHFYFFVFNFSLLISLNFRKVSKSQTVVSFLSHLKKKSWNQSWSTFFSLAWKDDKEDFWHLFEDGMKIISDI